MSPTAERTEPRILVVDLETSGLNPEAHSILQFGAEWLMGGHGEFSFECRMWNGAGIDPRALEINGCSISRCNDERLPGEATAIREFVQWVGEDPVIIAGLNPSIDVRFLNAACIRANAPRRFTHRVLDLHTLTVSYALAKGELLPSRGLYTDEVYAMLDLPPEPMPHVGIIGARKQAEALRMLLGIPTLTEAVS